nr:MAG TPA: hypothetical protein [Caudoviricetes sp.]
MQPLGSLAAVTSPHKCRVWKREVFLPKENLMRS